MLKLAGEAGSSREKIEQIRYVPGNKNTGDLEAGTKEVTATSKPGTADYSAALTLPKPDDARLVVKRLVARLQVTRDSGTSSNLYCTVSVDSADGSTNKLFDGVDVQAASLQATDLTSGTIFDLLSDGAEHTFYFFFWVDAGNSVISLVQLWKGVGTCSTGNQIVAELSHCGFASFSTFVTKVGTGAPQLALYADPVGWDAIIVYFTTSRIYHTDSLCLIESKLNFRMKGTVATDLNYLDYVGAILRSEQ